MKSKLFSTCVALLIAMVMIVALQKSEFTITRSAVLAAPAPVLFSMVNDFHAWNRWSPWVKLDPQAKNTLRGSPSGVGATFAWEGNRDVGSGRMEIIESRPYEKVGLKLEFIKPFPAHNVTEFTFRVEGQGTRVTWTMSGKNNFMGKAMGLLIDCDKMVGGQFEQGLKNLEAAAQATRKA